MTPQTAYNPYPTTSSHIATTTAAASQRKSPGEAGDAAPAPTKTIPSATSNGPPAPQQGAVPVPQPSTTAAKFAFPPPRKADAEPQPPGNSARVQTQPIQPQPYPYQMSQPPLGPGPNGLPPASTTSSTPTASFAPATPPTSLPVSADSSTRTNFEHPPGYVQNPYASDMTPDQRFATEQQKNETQSETVPSLGYNDNASKTSNSGLENDQSVIEAAMKWGKEKGRQLGDLHEQVWDSIGRR